MIWIVIYIADEVSELNGGHLTKKSSDDILWQINHRPIYTVIYIGIEILTSYVYDILSLYMIWITEIIGGKKIDI